MLSKDFFVEVNPAAKLTNFNALLILQSANFLFKMSINVISGLCFVGGKFVGYGDLMYLYLRKACKVICRP